MLVADVCLKQTIPCFNCTTLKQGFICFTLKWNHRDEFCAKLLSQTPTERWSLSNLPPRLQITRSLWQTGDGPHIWFYPDLKRRMCDVEIIWQWWFSGPVLLHKNIQGVQSFRPVSVRNTLRDLGSFMFSLVTGAEDPRAAASTHPYLQQNSKCLILPSLSVLLNFLSPRAEGPLSHTPTSVAACQLLLFWVLIPRSWSCLGLHTPVLVLSCSQYPIFVVVLVTIPWSQSSLCLNIQVSGVSLSQYPSPGLVLFSIPRYWSHLGLHTPALVLSLSWHLGLGLVLVTISKSW